MKRDILPVPRPGLVFDDENLEQDNYQFKKDV